ncbi:Na(+)-translocating NADH-quinone reductase subunit C [candidate division KSB1 bacterium]|nr:Na(+)-translocating NADH-quinone reductase subunit C [candidate division KSB1 bacterium]
MSNDSTRKTIIVALGVCLVCSILVATAAVSLSGRQQANKKLDKIKNILIAGDLLEDNKDVEKIYKDKIKPEIVNLETGRIISKDQYNETLNVDDFDIKKVADDPEYGKRVPSDIDIALIKKMPKFMTIYEVKDMDQIEKYILPVYGYGLWSTLYGFLALDKDLKTVQGITFYEHGETPGLGGEVDNPRWKQLWKDKIAFDDDWNVKLTVIKGKVDASSPEAKYQVDGLSGSTLTTRGVDHLVKFWLSDNGYGPFLANQREGMYNE